MITLDIPFPDTEYQIMHRYKTFNLIYPLEHPLSQTIKIDMVIRALSFSDPDYLSFIQNNKKPQDLSPIGGKIYEISYLRDCAAHDVASFEWNKNYGPNSLSEFLKITRTGTPDMYVKVISLRSPSYSLQELNRHYKKNE